MKKLLFILTLIVSGLFIQMSVFSQNVRPEWIQHFGGISFETGNFVTMDNNDYVYLTGDFTDTADFGDTVLISTGSADAFIAKYDTLGNLIWINTISGSSEEFGVAIDFDEYNNVILGGVFHSDTAYIGDTLIYSCGCSQFAFVAKYNENGDFIWANGIQGDGSIVLRDLKVKSNNDVVFIGQFYHSIFLGTDTIFPNGLSDIFIVKYDASGNGLWYETYGGNNIDDAYSIEIDQHGNMYMSGHYTGKATYGSNTLNAIGQGDIFIVKLDAAGTDLWGITAGSPGEDRSFDLYLDNQKNMFITGYAMDSAVFGNTILYSAGYYDFILAKYDSLGNCLWANMYGGVFDDQGNSINQDENGDIYVTGKFISNMSIDTTSLTANMYSDIFIAKFNTTGTNNWAKQFVGERNDEGTCIYPFGNNKFYLTGNYRDSVLYDTTMVYSYGNNDILFSKFSKDIIINLPDISFLKDYQIYPNPATDFLNVSKSFTGKISIFDQRGRLVITANKNRIDLSFLRPGVYVVLLEADKQIHRKILIKY